MRQDRRPRRRARSPRARFFPGLNDPVVVAGALYGPFGGPGTASRIEGQLTVTRGDMLAGLVDEVQRAFRVSGPGGDDERCLHLVLPGDTAEAITHGEGVILAWPAHG